MTGSEAVSAGIMCDCPVCRREIPVMAPIWPGGVFACPNCKERLRLGVESRETPGWTVWLLLAAMFAIGALASALTVVCWPRAHAVAARPSAPPIERSPPVVSGEQQATSETAAKGAAASEIAPKGTVVDTASPDALTSDAPTKSSDATSKSANVTGQSSDASTKTLEAPADDRPFGEPTESSEQVATGSDSKGESAPRTGHSRRRRTRSSGGSSSAEAMPTPVAEVPAPSASQRPEPEQTGTPKSEPAPTPPESPPATVVAAKVEETLPLEYRWQPGSEVIYGVTGTRTHDEKAISHKGEWKLSLGKASPQQVIAETVESARFGIVVSKKGHLLTFLPGLTDAKSISIVLYGQTVPTRVKAVDKDTGLVLVQVDGLTTEPVSLAPNAPVEGLVAHGFKLDPSPVRGGRFSLVDVTLGSADESGEFLVQPHVTGGSPLFDADRRLIGVVRAAISPDTLEVAPRCMSLELVRAFLVKHGVRPEGDDPPAVDRFAARGDPEAPYRRSLGTLSVEHPRVDGNTRFSLQASLDWEGIEKQASGSPSPGAVADGDPPFQGLLFRERNGTEIKIDRFGEAQTEKLGLFLPEVNALLPIAIEPLSPRGRKKWTHWKSGDSMPGNDENHPLVPLLGEGAADPLLALRRAVQMMAPFTVASASEIESSSDEEARIARRFRIAVVDTNRKTQELATGTSKSTFDRKKKLIVKSEVEWRIKLNGREAPPTTLATTLELKAVRDPIEVQREQANQVAARAAERLKKSDEIRAAAKVASQEYWRAKYDGVVGALTGDDRAAKIAALEKLAKGPAARDLRKSVLEAVLPLLSSDDVELVAAALAASAMWDDDDHVKPATAALDHRDLAVRKAAIAYFARTLRSASFDTLIDRLASDDAEHIVAALAGTGWFAEPRLAKYGLNHPNQAIRAASCRLLANIASRQSTFTALNELAARKGPAGDAAREVIAGWGTDPRRAARRPSNSPFLTPEEKEAALQAERGNADGQPAKEAKTDDEVKTDEEKLRPLATPGGESRVWTSADGLHQTKGRFVGLEDKDVIRIKRADGKHIWAPHAALSRKDQGWLRQETRNYGLPERSENEELRIRAAVREDPRPLKRDAPRLAFANYNDDVAQGLVSRFSLSKIPFLAQTLVSGDGRVVIVVGSKAIAWGSFESHRQIVYVDAEAVHPGYSSLGAVSRDGGTIVVLNNDNEFETFVVDVSAGTIERTARRRIHTKVVKQMALAPDGATALSIGSHESPANDHASIIVWDVATGTILSEREGPPTHLLSPELAAARFSEDGRFAMAVETGERHLIDLHRDLTVRRESIEAERANQVAIFPDLSRVVTGSFQGASLHEWDGVAHRLDGLREYSTDRRLFVPPDSEHLYVACEASDNIEVAAFSRFATLRGTTTAAKRDYRQWKIEMLPDNRHFVVVRAANQPDHVDVEVYRMEIGSPDK